MNETSNISKYDSGDVLRNDHNYCMILAVERAAMGIPQRKVAMWLSTEESGPRVMSASNFECRYWIKVCNIRDGLKEFETSLHALVRKGHFNVKPEI